MRLFVFLLISFSVVTSAVSQEVSTNTKSSSVKGPLSPEESLKHLVLADPNLVIEIVAAEPEVIDPVAIQFDEHGRLWVVELSDYPNGPEPGKPPLSRIKLLEDKDGDGRFETAHIFADKLLFATGVQPWDGGVIVTLAGEVAYFKDTDGDHKADVRETWFTGFAQANPQLRANHPTFGPDGWIYVANGLRGGNVISVKKDWPSRLGTPARPSDKSNDKESGKSAQPTEPQSVSLTGRDFKFDPLTGRYEAISGNGQFGMTFDAWGNRFVCDNRHPCRHVIFEEDFIKRCPHVAFPAVVHDVIPADDKNRVFPLTSAWTTSNLHAGTFTASCGVTVYTGDWLPEEFRGNVFVCEPTGNLVQRAILEPDGVTFKSRNPYQRSSVAPQPRFPNASPTSTNNSTSNSQTTPNDESRSWNDRATGTQEFLASRDDWFRPVDLQNGPDGALYVVDMYRAVIEHPEWVPDELKKRPDTWLGNDKGRIYRIRPKGKWGNRPQNVGVSKSLEELIDSKNGWHRMTAARLRRAGPYQDVAWRADAKTDEGKCLAIQLEPKTVIGDQTYQVWDNYTQSNAWVQGRLASLARFSSWSKNDKELFVISTLHTGDEEDRSISRKYGAIEVAYFRSEDFDWTGYLQEATAENANDYWIRLALVGAVGADDAWQFIDLAISQWDVRPEFWNQSGLAEEVMMFGEVVGNRADIEEVGSAISRLSRKRAAPAERVFELNASAVIGIANGLSRRGQSLNQILPKLSGDTRMALESIFDSALQQIESLSDGSPEATKRIQLLLRLLRHAPSAKVGVIVKKLAETSTDQTLRFAAVESFASFRNSEVDAWLVERYRSETPAIRRAILAALFASKERQLRLLEAIEQGQIAATELGPVQANQLTQSKDETVRERAKTILAAAAPASRKEVLDAYQPALSLKADPKRGRELFVKNCSTCHRVDNVGVNVAPDISDTRTKKPEQLLLDIVDPNKAIDANYFAYAVALKDGTVQSGVISAETATSITLKQPEGKVLTLLRSDIEELRNTGLSLMPVGLEKNVDQQAMADLIFWLKNWRYLDGKVPATSLSGQ